jgi:hypothetical protein
MEETDCHVTHKVLLNFLECRGEEDDRERRYGGPFVGG